MKPLVPTLVVLCFVPVAQAAPVDDSVFAPAAFATNRPLAGDEASSFALGSGDSAPEAGGQPGVDGSWRALDAGWRAEGEGGSPDAGGLGEDRDRPEVSPVPEPSSIALLSAGIAIAALSLRRRRRAD